VLRHEARPDDEERHLDERDRQPVQERDRQRRPALVIASNRPYIR